MHSTSFSHFFLIIRRWLSRFQKYLLKKLVEVEFNFQIYLDTFQSGHACKHATIGGEKKYYLRKYFA